MTSPQVGSTHLQGPGLKSGGSKFRGALLLSSGVPKDTCGFSQRTNSGGHTAEGLCAVVGGPGFGTLVEEEEKGGQLSSPGAVPPHRLSSYSVMELLDSECHGSEYLSAREGSRDDFWTGTCVGMCAAGSCSHGHLLLWLRLSLQGRKQFLPTSRHHGSHCWGNVVLGKA